MNDEFYEPENCPTLEESVFIINSNGKLEQMEVTDDASND